MKKPQLFLLHFAGGNFYSFQFLIPLLSEFEVVPLELPGRGRRMGERLLKDFDQAAEEMYGQIVRELYSPVFLVYGHSMGAYLALRVSRMLEKANRPPAYLVVSGSAGPGTEDDKKRYLMEKRRFIDELKILGGFPQELIDARDFFDMYEPVLRADFEIAERFDLSNEPAVNIPIHAIMGSQEEKVDLISNWGRFTTQQINVDVMEGDHFFIHKHPARMAGILSDCYRSAIFPQRL